MQNLKPNFNLGIFGKSESGKTHLMKYIILFLYKYFNSIILISSTICTGQYDFIKNLNIKSTLLNYENLDIKLTKIMEKQNDITELFKNGKIKHENKILLVFDDGQGALNVTNILRSLNIKYRHINISIIFGFQNITSLKPEIRRNLSHICVFKLRSDSEIQTLQKEFIPHISKKEINSYLDKGFDKKYKFLYVDRHFEKDYFQIAPPIHNTPPII